MVFVPRGLNLQPHILTANENPSCEHTYGQAISGKTSGCGSRAESGNRLFLWLVDGFNPNVAWLEHLRVLWAVQPWRKSKQWSGSRDPGNTEFCPWQERDSSTWEGRV